MNILITGGAGFIGSHLCKRLIEQGNQVICVDNFITGSKNNVSELLGSQNFKLLEHDISIPLYVAEDLDWIMHLASIASPKHYISYPIKTLKSGLLGTHNCLGLAKAKNAKFFFTSTSEVYGDPDVHPQIEEYNGNVSITGMRSCYDESKRAGESLAYAYVRQHRVDVRVIRIFNTYGPNMMPDDGRVISNFIMQALKGEDITIYGTGSQTRSFCYVDDLVSGILKMMDTNYNKPVNLGNDGEYKIIELADKIIKLTGASSKINFFPAQEDDPRKRRPDLTKAKELFNWKPNVGIEDGLKKTIGYFRVAL